MDYSFKFVLFYLLLQIILIVCSYFYYNNYIKNVYLRHGKLTFFAGFSQFAVFAAHAFILYLPNFLFTDWPDVQVGTVSIISGILVCAISLIVLVAGFITVGPLFRTMGLNTKDLTVKGIYKYSRNPQIIGYGFLLSGFGIIWPSWYIFAGLISYIFIAHKMVLTEELHLGALFADRYVAYCNMTPRYFRYPSK